MDKYAIFQACQKTFSNWKLCPELSINKLMSGTNDVYEVKSPNAEPASCIFRVFGANKLNSAISRKDYELMAANSLVPKIYMEEENYRIEEFIQSKRITPNDKKELYFPSIINKIAELHNISDKFASKTHFKSVFHSVWLDSINYNYIASINSNEIHEYLRVIKNNALMSKLKVIDSKMTCINHNDISLKNVLLSDNKAYLIDFEYLSNNDAGYDLASLFEECMTDYDNKLFPYFRINPLNQVTKSEAHEYCSYYYSLLRTKQYSLQELIENVEENRLLFYLYSSTWGLINIQRLDWGYEYFLARWKVFSKKCSEHNIKI